MKLNPSGARLVTILMATLAGLVIGRFSAPRAHSVSLAQAAPAEGTERRPEGASAASPPRPRSIPDVEANAGLRYAISGWDGIQKQPPSVARDAEAAAWLARYAAEAPEAALALALDEPNRTRRRLWRSAALRGWAATAPAAAAAWIVAQAPGAESTDDITASFAATASTPATALRLARRFASYLPGGATEQGGWLIAALADAGEFNPAVQFALSGNAEQRDVWIASAFSRWSEQQPRAATTAANSLPETALRDVAWRAAVVNWAQNEPASLADYALKLPAGEARTYAFGEALRLWIDQDVVRASGWLGRLGPGQETDLAASLVATHPVMAAHRPETALSWAERISEPTARSRTVARVVQIWSNTDPTAAAQYARTTDTLLPADREESLPGDRSTPHP